MITVVIPTYNRSAYLKETVTSVLGQVGVRMEVIVVDDGSTDDTAAVLAPFGSSIRYVFQPRKGVSAARNTGIGLANAEWLAFLDSDDLWLPRKLAAQMEFLSLNPEIRICQTEEIWIRNGRRINPGKYHQKPDGYCFSQLLKRCLVSPSAVMIHRSLFDEVGHFDESLPACEDYDLWLRIGYRYPIALVKEPLVIKRGGHPDQLSASVPALDRYRIQSLANLLSRERLDPVQKGLVLDVLEHKCRIYAQGCRKRGRKDEADAVLSLSQKLSPTPDAAVEPDTL